MREGDTFSPNHFTFFINDLVYMFGDDCDVVSMGDIKINCLIYAYDFSFISQSERSSQNILNKLETYCGHWCLYTNTDKTKSIVFNQSGKS